MCKWRINYANLLEVSWVFIYTNSIRKLKLINILDPRTISIKTLCFGSLLKDQIQNCGLCVFDIPLCERKRQDFRCDNRCKIAFRLQRLTII